MKKLVLILFAFIAMACLWQLSLPPGPAAGDEACVIDIATGPAAASVSKARCIEPIHIGKIRTRCTIDHKLFLASSSLTFVAGTVSYPPHVTPGICPVLSAAYFQFGQRGPPLA